MSNGSSTEMTTHSQGRSGRLMPGPEGTLFFGSLFDAWRDPIGLFLRAQSYGPVCRFRFGPYTYVALNDPACVRHVLVDNPKNYTKSRNYRGLKLVVGDGLLTSEGEFWKRQRRLTQPAFHRERLAGFADTMAQATHAMLDTWPGEGDEPRTLDVHAEMMALTFRIVGLTLLSVDLAGDAEVTGEALTIALEWANDYVESLVPIPPWVPTPKNVRFKKAARTLDGVVLRVIEERRKSGERKNDLLQMLMEVKDEDSGEVMNDRQLKDELMTLVLAGHETTANALAFTFYLLSRHPEVARRARAEVREALGDRDPTLADLPKLGYVRQIIDESMRLYPPAWAFERQAIADDEIGGFPVRAGTLIGVSPFTLHRDPAHWTNPEGFDPERFAPSEGGAAARPKYAYLPFGGGPRVCIGSSFALMEAQIVVAMVLARARLDLLPGARLELDAKVTLRPRGGLPMVARPA